MRVELSDPDLVDDLVTFLRSARYEAEHADEGTLAVRPPASVPAELAQIALEESLAAWQTLHPGVHVRRRCAYDL